MRSQSVITCRCPSPDLILEVSDLYWTQKKITCTVYSMQAFSARKRCYAIFILCLNTEKVFRAMKMNITTKAVKLKCTDLFDSRRGQNLKKFEVILKVWILLMCEFPFLDFYRTPFVNKMFKPSLQMDVIEAHHLECHTSGHLTPTFTVCTEESRDKVKWRSAVNKSA